MREEEFMKLEKIVESELQWTHRPENVYSRDGKALVSQVSTEGRSLKGAVKLAVDAIGGFRKSLDPGDKVLLKANFNSDDPFPASTSLDFLEAVVELLREEGITNLTLGERSGWPWLPTDRVLRELGVYEVLERIDLPLIVFDEGPWVDIKLREPTEYWPKIAFHKSILDFDRIVFLPCMKHHFLARFTMSLKLIIGMTHTVEMKYLHANTLSDPKEPFEEKIPELSLPIGPDLIIMDGRKSFITGGPDTGDLVEPKVIMASGDRIAIDVEGVKILQSYEADNLLQMDVWELPVIAGAVKLSLGAASEADYTLVKL